MKATGIVRRIDDLGRVVIPKEIRRTMRIREGDPLEIYTTKEGEVIFKKYPLMGDMDDLANQFCDALSKNVSSIVAVTDRDTIISVAGGGKRELLEKRISSELERILEDRRLYLGSDAAPISAAEGNDKYTVYLAAPILSQRCDGLCPFYHGHRKPDCRRNGTGPGGNRGHLPGPPYGKLKQAPCRIYLHGAFLQASSRRAARFRFFTHSVSKYSI